jgi:hypothetical protein
LTNRLPSRFGSYDFDLDEDLGPDELWNNQQHRRRARPTEIVRANFRVSRDVFSLTSRCSTSLSTANCAPTATRWMEQRSARRRPFARCGSKVTLDRPDLVKDLSFIHEPRKVPVCVVSSPRRGCPLPGGGTGHQVQGGAERRHGAGLRVSEVVSLKVSDTASKRMDATQGKGRKDRRHIEVERSRAKLSNASSMPRPAAASNTRTCCPTAAASTSRSAGSLIGIPLVLLSQKVAADVI